MLNITPQSLIKKLFNNPFKSLVALNNKANSYKEKRTNATTPKLMENTTVTK